jgi:hypothetical protein
MNHTTQPPEASERIERDDARRFWLRWVGANSLAGMIGQGVAGMVGVRVFACQPTNLGRHWRTGERVRPRRGVSLDRPAAGHGADLIF